MLDLILESIVDTLKTAPLLFFVYLLIGVLENRIKVDSLLPYQKGNLGPLVGACLGCLPQCGISAAASTMYNYNMLGSATLVAIFLSTSDEAIPILITNIDSAPYVVYLIIAKLFIAILAGYVLKFTIFRNEKLDLHQTVTNQIPEPCCHKHKPAAIHALIHTFKISVFIFVTLAVINVLFYLIGEENISKFLMGGTIFQPFIVGILGLIPGCATSVFITQLFLEGTITFGSAIAGLSAGAGFGYLILFKSKKIKNSLKIVLLTYVISVIFGVILNIFW